MNKIQYSQYKIWALCIFVFFNLYNTASASELLRMDYYVWERFEAKEKIDAEQIKNVDILFYFRASGPDENGRVYFSDEGISHLKKLKKVINPATKLWFSVSNLSSLKDNPIKMKGFIQSVQLLAETHGFKGLDINWEGQPAEDSVLDYANVVSYISDNIKSEHFGLSISLGSGGHYLDKTVAVKDKIDWANIQLYWSDHNSWSVSTVSKKMQLFIEKGVPTNKLSLGFPTYGMQKMSNYKQGDKHKSYSYMIKNGASIKDNIWLDPKTEINYHYTGIPLLKEKIKYGKDSAYRGIFTWELTMDADYGSKASLIRTIDQQLEYQ